MAVRFGTSSFSEPSWVGPFYPPKTRPSDYLRLYAKKYDTVEIDSTYYAIPTQQTVQTWAGKTPDGFLFTAKFPRSIVHGGQDAKPDPSVILVPEITYPLRDQFLASMASLGPKQGPLLLQFPYFSRDAMPHAKTFFNRLEHFLGDLPKDRRYAVEVRNRAWLTDSFADLLRAHNVALTLVDQAWMPHADEVEQRFDPITTDFTYIRLMGERKEIEAITTTWNKEVIDRGDRLNRWAEFIGRIVERKVNVFVFVNNHYAGHAPATLDRLREMVGETAGAV